MRLKYYFLTFIISLITTSVFGQIYINEIMAANDSALADSNGEYDDWIEIYNDSNSPINLADYYLSNDPLEPNQYQIPISNSALTTIPANGYLIIWADNDTEQGAHHTNFKLSASGGSVHLYDTDGTTLVSEITFPAMEDDFSYGRLEDGGNSWQLFPTASPNVTNSASQAQLDAPIIVPESGLYSGTQRISISADASSSIYYTTDGSEPNSSSLLYTTPFTINSTSTIRAITIKNGSLNSPIETASYIINSDHDLAILSVNIDPKYLWSDTEGMYVEGTNGTTADCSRFPANYWQEWEYSSNVIMFDELGNKVFDVDGGLSVFGNCSRRNAQKGLQLKTKKQYPSPNIPYQVFPQIDQEEFRRLRFRIGGNQWKTSMMGDLLVQSLAENKLDLEIQSSRPSVMYLNNEYWGIHNIRETYSKHYFEYKFPKYKNDSIEIVRIAQSHTEFVTTDNSATDLEQLYEYFENVNSFSAADYDYAASQIDFNNFLNYYILQMWVYPADWPSTRSPSNKIYWRSISSNSKWRMAVLDTDRGWEDASNNTIEYMMVPGSDSDRNNPRSTLLFRRLMDVPDFRNEFIQRYATQLNLIYDPSRVNNKIDNYKNQLDSEITAHTALWGPQGGVEDYDTWVTEVDKLKSFADLRGDIVRNHITEFFNVSTFNLTTNFDENSNGKVVVNSNYFEVPYNYTGTYFTDTPIEIHAIPAPGYRFSHWQETGDTNANLHRSFTSNTVLTPIFVPSLALIINEVHYHPNDTINKKEFIEIYNPDSQARALDRYEFSNGICFTFPEGTTIGANEYIIVAEDASQYDGNGYQVFQWEKSGLDKDGEIIVLQNPLQQSIDSIFYNDENPWDEGPDGQGYSLELLHPSFDNTNPLNWFRSDQINGTPGAENSRICNTVNVPIVINEINYNSDNTNFDPGDWIELYNPNTSPVDLTGWAFYDNGNAFVLPSGTSIGAMDYLVLVEDVATFTSAFPNVSNSKYIGDLGFTLSNNGERISLFDTNKCLVDYVQYNDKSPWPTAPDGGGSTLVLLDPILDNALAVFWKASDDLSPDYIHGSPGKSNLCTGISIVTSQINRSSDDAEEKMSDGSISITSGDLDIVNDEGKMYTIGLRFRDIDIPQGATITSAVIGFTADEINTDATNFIIKGQAINNALSFTTGNNNITNRNTTTSAVTWEPKDWEIIGENGPNQHTVDLSNIVQEIVDRSGFSSGNAIAFIIEGTGIRTAESYDGSPALAPKLWITHTSGDCGVQAKVLLEGFYDAGTQEMHTKLQDKGLLPTQQPFNVAPWNYTGTESATTLPSTAVEWVLVASRKADGTITNQSAGFIDKTGNLMSVEGNTGIPLVGAKNQNFSIHTRSHLAILSADVYTEGIYDFTTAVTQAQGIKQLKLVAGKYVLYAGDYDGSGLINNTDFNKWKVQSAQLNEYLPIDGDGNGIINAADYNLWIGNRSKIGEEVIRY